MNNESNPASKASVLAVGAELTTSQMWMLALPSLTLGMIHGPASGILGSIYASYFGISLAAIGYVTFVARVFDAVTDPMIGYLSDRLHTPWGHRKPFVMVGMPVVCLAMYFVYQPPAAPSTAYFLSWFLLLYLGWTLMEIPLAAWSAEVTGSAPGRMRLFMLRWMLTSGGWVLMFAIPFLPVFATTEITPETLNWIGWIGLATLPILTIIAIAKVGQGPEMAVREEFQIWSFVKAASKNGPFLIFLVTAVISGIATGVYFALNFLYFTQVLGYTKGFAILGLVTAIVAIPAYYFWARVSDLIDHFRMAAVSVFGIAFFSFLIWFIPPGEQYFPLALAITCGGQACASGWWLSTGPMLADAADYDLLRSGVNRVGKYFSFQALINKLTNGFGGSIGFILLALIGYDASIGAINDASTILRFKIVFVVVPALLAVIGAIAILRFPIDRHRHNIIRARLEARVARV